MPALVISVCLIQQDLSLAPLDLCSSRGNAFEMRAGTLQHGMPASQAAMLRKKGPI